MRKKNIALRLELILELSFICNTKRRISLSAQRFNIQKERKKGKKMSESEARAVTASAGLPWGSRGKALWEQWKKDLTAQGKMKTDKTKLGFSRYVNSRREARPGSSAKRLSDKDVSSDDEEDDEDFFFEDTDAEQARKAPSLEDEIRQVVDADRTASASTPTENTALLNLARTLTGTEEEEKQEDQQSRKISQSIAAQNGSMERSKHPRPTTSYSSNRKTVADEVAEKEETSDFINIMSSSTRQKSKGKALHKDDSFWENDYDEEEEEDDSDFVDSAENNTFGKLASVAMEAVQKNSKHPAKMLQFLSTRSGQDIVLDKLHSCCMSAIHRDHSKCSMKGGGFKCDMAKGCEHFYGIQSDEEYKGLNQLHSQLKHASSDDAAFQVLAQCAGEAFDEVADIAINAYEQNSNTEDSPYFEISANVSTNKDLSEISNKDLESITHNYQEVSATPFAAKHSPSFATWGDSALKSSKADLRNKANKVTNEVINWLNDGSGARYEGDIYLGYQCVVATLVSLIAQMPRNYSDARDISRASQLVERMLKAIQTSHSKGSLDAELMNYEVTGHARSGRGKRGKLKRFTRRVFKKVTKLTTSNEVGFLKEIIKACYDNYEERLAIKRSSQSGSPISDDTKNEIAREMMDDYLMSRMRTEAARIFKAVRGLALGGRHFDNFHLTIRVMAITAAMLLSKKSSTYGGFDSSFAKRNLTDAAGFLPIAIDSVSDDIRKYSVTRGLAKATRRGVKHGKKGAKRLHKERKKHLKIRPHEIVLSSHIPNPSLSKQDRQLEGHEREFLRRAILHTIGYANEIFGDDDDKSIHRFVIIIPDQRKFRNAETRKVTDDHAYRWVMQRPSVLGGIRERKSNDSRNKVNTYNRPALHELWTSLPPIKAKDLSVDSEDRFRFRFYSDSNRLERVNTEPPPLHSSYVDSDGKVVRLKTKRDKKHIHLSHTFDPEDEQSEEILSKLEEHVPHNVHITFRRAFD